MVNNFKNVRVFRQGYEELYQLGNQTVGFMVTDLEMFNKYGVTTEDVEQIRELTEKVGGRDFDEKFLIVQLFKSEQKELLKDEVTKLLIDLDILLSKKFGTKSKNYQIFEISNVRGLTDNLTAATALRCYNLLTSEFTESLGWNFTVPQDLLDGLLEKGTALRRLIDEHDEAEKIRHLATQVRIGLANELSQKVIEVRKIGRKMWALTDEVKSNSYRLPQKRGKSDDPDDSSDEQDSFLGDNTQATSS